MFIIPGVWLSAHCHSQRQGAALKWQLRYTQQQNGQILPVTFLACLFKLNIPNQLNTESTKHLTAFISLVFLLKVIQVTPLISMSIPDYLSIVSQWLLWHHGPPQWSPHPQMVISTDYSLQTTLITWIIQGIHADHMGRIYSVLTKITELNSI